MKKLIMIDLDGVLNNYDGKYDKKTIHEPKCGVDNFLKQLYENYEIQIFTVRDKTLTAEWLKKHNLDKYVSGITNIKNPFASIFIDDRAICFEGDFGKTLEKIKNFKPYWK